MNSRSARIYGMLGASLLVLSGGISAFGEPQLESISRTDLVLVEKEPARTVVLYADGREIEVQPEIEWRFMVGTDISNKTMQDLLDTVETCKALEKDDPPPPPTPKRDTRSGLDIEYNVLSSLPPGAQAAMAAVEAYLESTFGDPINVTISLRFAVLGDGILGSTAPYYTGYIPWNDVRDGLIADMDSDDVIHPYLRVDTIPVRYNGNSSTVTLENRARVTRANFNAGIGSDPGIVGSMTFNTNYDWDFTPPSINPTYVCFQSVLVHEIGHALGFVSRADYVDNDDISLMDAFRFQESDPDYNPSTYAEFTTTPRVVDGDTLPNDSISDIIIAEFAMTNAGGPVPPGRQASHFYEFGPVYIMRPTFGSGGSFYPDFLRFGDISMFDVIGWDYPIVRPPREPASPDNARKNRYISFDPNAGGAEVAFEIELLESYEFPGSTGVLGWIGEPDGNGISHIVDTPFYNYFWPSVVHVSDCRIVPVTTYGVRATEDGAIFSSTYEVGTILLPGVWYYGDTVGIGLGYLPPQIGFSAPNQIVNVNDVTAYLLTADGDLTPSVPIPWVDLHGLGDGAPPNYLLNVSDLQRILFGLEGDFYADAADQLDPADCP